MDRIRRGDFAWAEMRPAFFDGFHSLFLKPVDRVEDGAQVAIGNADGTGTDQYWKDYVTAIVQHVCTPGPCKISNWEVWNEPNSGTMWQGTLPQLVRLTQDAYQIIKGINLNLIVSGPTIADGGDPQSTAPSFLQTFLQDGGEQYIDVIGFH